MNDINSTTTLPDQSITPVLVGGHEVRPRPCGILHTITIPVTIEALARHHQLVADVSAAATRIRDADPDGDIVIILSVDHDAEVSPSPQVEFVVRHREDHDVADDPCTAVYGRYWGTGHDLPGWAAANATAMLARAGRVLASRVDVGLVYVRAIGGEWIVSPIPQDLYARGIRCIDVESHTAAEAALIAWLRVGCPRTASIRVVPARDESLVVDVENWVLAYPEPYYERVHAFPALTRAIIDRQLPDGADVIVREIHRANTAEQRADSRCRAVRAALVQYVLDECWSVSATPDQREAVAEWVLRGGAEPQIVACWHVGIPRINGRIYTADEGEQILLAIRAFELHGIGGYGDLGGHGISTATMSWRSGLGKGRRHASDGDAWDAAVRGAGCDIGPDVALMAVPHVRPVDLAWPMGYALSQAYAHRDDVDLARQWCDVARAVMARALDPGSPSEGFAIALGTRYGVS